MTAHYTGNNVIYKDKVTAEVVKQIQQVFHATKPFEYNYVIGQEENNDIYEFAGEYKAAHSAGENTDSVGVLFLLGVGEKPTWTMINKWRWLREHLISKGLLSSSAIQLPHKLMPGAATSCAGPQIDAVWKELIQPYKENMQVLPIRIFDSRPWGVKFKPGTGVMPLESYVSSIPKTVKKLRLGITAVNPVGEGYVTLWGGGPIPNISNLNYTVQNAPITNYTEVNVSGHQFNYYVHTETDLIFDVFSCE